MNNAYIALGSNLGDKYAFLQNAIERIDKVEGIVVVTTSSVYETPPVGYSEQDSFYNMVIHIQTKFSPQQLLVVLQKIETEAGRVRTIKNGPRTLDLDILLYENCIVEEKDLQIPHPRMHERLFVLVPLADVLSNYTDYVGQECVCLEGAVSEGIKKVPLQSGVC
ncbi:MAG: 2-amino-4-hydroxy-6-hydroxymethyldihydropteridine diphosphokinase [Bacilli bacterium]